MEESRIRFDDGAAYEDFMGKWSESVGDTFLDWLAPPAGGRWVDVGCGNGAFTARLVERCAPAAVDAMDPSEEQLAFARTRRLDVPVRWRQGDAMALPYADEAFDAAVMALVIFFVPEPAKAVAEMARVVRPDGCVAAYTWDFDGGGFPYAALQDEMAKLGVPPLPPPSRDAARIDSLRALWAGAGLVAIETRTIDVERTYADFDTFWKIARAGPPIAPRIAAMRDVDQVALRDRLRARLHADGDGRITYGARANAIEGRVPVR